MTHYEKEKNKINNQDFKLLVKKIRELFFEHPEKKPFLLDNFYNFIDAYYEIMKTGKNSKVESRDYKIFLIKKICDDNSSTSHNI